MHRAGKMVQKRHPRLLEMSLEESAPASGAASTFSLIAGGESDSRGVYEARYFYRP